MSSINRLLRAFSTATATATATATTATPSVKALSNELFREQSLEGLVEKFKKSSEFNRFRSNTVVYAKTVRLLARAKRFELIEEILEEQKKYNDISREGFAVRIISLYGKSGMFDNAHKLFDEMPKLNCVRTVWSFNALLAACVNSKKFDEIDAFFKELPAELSIEPDLVSYNTVIKALCESNSFHSAVSMLDEMEKKGIAPDLVTFNTILYALYVNDRFSDAEKIWNQMVKKNISPDIRTYNAKLHGLVFEKRMGEAVEFVEEMRSTGIKPDVFSFNALIRGFVNEKNVKEARRWYSEMGDNGFGGDKMTFTTLVPFLIENGDDELAFELCKEIFKQPLLVDESILQLTVDELVKKLKIDEAKELVVLGKTNNGHWRYRLKLPQDK